MLFRSVKATECFIESFLALDVFFMMYVPYVVCTNVLHGDAASACDHKYGLIFKSNPFFDLKNRLCTYCSVGKINPRHYI